MRSLTEGRPIDGCAWSPDGQTLAVVERYDTFLAGADTGQVFAELRGTTGPVVWAPDGKHLATAGPDNAVRLRGPDGKVRLTLAGHEARVSSLAWSPDGKRLASTAAGEKRVLLWRADKSARDRELGPFPGVAENVRWSRDGRLVAFNVTDVGWHVWDVQQNRLVNDPGQWKLVWIDLAPDGRSAVVASGEGDVYRLRDLATGKEGAQLPCVHYRYMAPPTWSPDGRLLTATDYSGTELWRPDPRQLSRPLQGQWGMDQVTFSRDGKLVAGWAGERLHIWETDTGRLRGVLLLGRWDNGLTITPDGHYTGNDQVERGIVMVVQKDDGTQELLEPAEFEQKYGFQNDPAKVRLTD